MAISELMCVTPAGKIGNWTCGMPKSLPHSRLKITPSFSLQTGSNRLISLPFLSMSTPKGSGVLKLVRTLMAHELSTKIALLVNAASVFAMSVRDRGSISLHERRHARRMSSKPPLANGKSHTPANRWIAFDTPLEATASRPLDTSYRHRRTLGHAL